MSDAPTIPDFHLNNPKNYLGYSIAFSIAAKGTNKEVKSILEENDKNNKRITRDVNGARAGAYYLELVEKNSDGEELTNLGRGLVEFATAEYDSESAALDALRTLFRKPTRFVETLPIWKTITQEVLLSHPGFARLVALMQDIHASRDEDSSFSLPILVQEMYHRHPKFAGECFVESAKRDLLAELSWEKPGSNSTPDELWSKSFYRPSIVHQAKSMLFHAGILTTSGKTRSNLEFSPDSDPFRWGLMQQFRDSTTAVSWRGSLDDELPDLEEQVRDVQPPQRNKSTISRIIRNSEMVKRLKHEHDFHCQVCGEQRRRAPEIFYAEGHHLHPLGEDGPDVRENIVIVCPNCHADLDYGMVKIDPITHDITHSYDGEIDDNELRTLKSHTVGRRYLGYHNQKVANW